MAAKEGFVLENEDLIEKRKTWQEKEDSCAEIKFRLEKQDLKWIKGYLIWKRKTLGGRGLENKSFGKKKKTWCGKEDLGWKRKTCEAKNDLGWKRKAWTEKENLGWKRKT